MFTTLLAVKRCIFSTRFKIINFSKAEDPDGIEFSTVSELRANSELRASFGSTQCPDKRGFTVHTKAFTHLKVHVHAHTYLVSLLIFT